MNTMWRRAFLLIAAIGLALSCSSDSNKPTSGFLLIRGDFEEPGIAKSGTELKPDSLTAEVRDSEELQLASATVAVPDTAQEVTLQIELDVAQNLTALVQADYGEGSDRGAVFFGSQDGISIEGGSTSEAHILLRSVVPEPPTVSGEPGEPTYHVHWKGVAGATGYLLRELGATGSNDYVITDTIKTFTPGLPRGVARAGSADRFSSETGLALPTTVRSYRVRPDLPLGPGIFSDSVSVDLDIWFDLPKVISVDPADSVEGILDESPIRIEFDREMDPLSFGGSGITLTLLGSQADIPFTQQPYNSNSAVMLTPFEPLDRGEWFRVHVSTGVTDAGGRPLDQDPALDGLQAFVSDFRVEEYDPLRVIQVSPADEAIDVETNATVLVQFNREIDPLSITATGFTVSDSAGPVSGDRRSLDQGLTLEFRASRPFVYDVEHEIHLDSTVVDVLRGEPLDQDPIAPGFQPFHSRFRTLPQPRGPRVVGSTPLPGGQHHPIWEPILIYFDRPIDPASVILGQGLTIQVYRFGSYFNITGEARVSTDSLTITFSPGDNLVRDESHRVIVAGGIDGIRDANGIALDQDPYTPGYQSYEFEFLTEQNVSVTSVSPSDDAENVPWDVVVTVRFSMPIQPESVTDANIGLYKSGERLTAALAIDPDSLEVSITPQELLVSYQVYEVKAGTGIRTRRGGSFDQDWEEDGHQEFSSTFRAIHETDPPYVVSVVPSEGSSGIPVDASVQVVFSEPVRPEKVLEYTYITREDSLGARVAGTITPSQDSLSALFEPDSPFEYITDYHVHVDTWVTDRFGNRLDQDTQQDGWQRFYSVFTTANEVDPPFVVTVDPADGATEVPVTTPVRIDFSESMDRNAMPAALVVYTEGDTLEGTLGFEDEDRTVVFTPEDYLHQDRIYNVSVDSLALDLAGNRFDQVPLTAPLEPFESSFRTEADQIGPMVLTVEPSDGATDVLVDVVPVIVFNEPVDPTTVTSATVLFADSIGVSVGSTLSLSANGCSLTVTPVAPLEFDTLHEFTVTSAVTDTLSNPLDNDPVTPGDQPFEASFRTQLETIAPFVVEMLLDGEPGEVPTDTDVRIRFSESIDPSSVDSTTFRLLLGPAEIAGSRTVSATGDTATFVPDMPLIFGSTYDVSVSGVRDLVGNLLDQDPGTPGEQGFEASFLTGADNEQPRVILSEPADGELGVDPNALLRLVFSEPMDVGSFTTSNPGLFVNGYPVETDLVTEPGDSSFVFLHDPLAPGEIYEWRAGTQLLDQAGNFFDQDPDTEGGQWFIAEFEVGDRPIADAGPGVCTTDATGEANFDGSGSYDPDGDIVQMTWDWGDGNATVFGYPQGLSVHHDYACIDDRGCDGVDNDGDGDIDESGADGCDESYRVILTIIDSDGFVASDTTGVSFCAFRVLTSYPGDGAVGVDVDTTIALNLTRACDPTSVDTSSVWLTIEGGDSITVNRTIENGGERIVLTPTTSLLPDTSYTVHAGESLRSAEGQSLDQEPCQLGMQRFQATFQTESAPAQPRLPVHQPVIKEEDRASDHLKRGRPGGQ